MIRPCDELIELPSGPLRVRVRGEGPPLLWCHGIFFPMEVDDESTLGRALCDDDLDLTVIRFDAPGHGASPPGPDAEAHRWDVMARGVLELCDHLGLEDLALGGISMGAAVALHAALLAPARVRAMLLFAPPTAWETRVAEQARYRTLLEFGSPEALARHVDDDLRAMFPSAPIPRSLLAMVAALERSTWPALERVIIGASLSDLPDRTALSCLDVPVLLRPWKGDGGHPLSTAEALAATLPQADLEVLESFDDARGMRDALRRLSGYFSESSRDVSAARAD